MADATTIPDYKQEMDHLVLIVQAIAAIEIDTDFLLKTLNDADSIGPFIDPTRWIHGSKNIAPQREIVEAFVAFQRVAKKAVADAIANQAALR